MFPSGTGGPAHRSRGVRSRGVRSRLVEAVAHAPHRLDQSGPGGIVLDLAAQSAYVDGDRREVAEVPAPHLAHQVLTRVRAAGVAQEEGEEVELAQGEREFGAVLGGAAGRRVDGEPGRVQR